jgi:hypothetical protein
MFNGLKIKTHVGIGDVIHMKQLLDDIKHNFSTIEIAPNPQTIKNYKNNYQEYYGFIIKLFEALFSETPYKINYSENFLAPNVWPDAYITSTGQTPKIPNLEKYLCNLDYPKNDNIVILTKIRGMSKDRFDIIKNDFFNILNKISKNNKLVLMGEKNIGLNSEYKDHPSIYSIYYELIKNLDHFEDKTIEELGNTAPDYNNFLYDCNQMNAAKNVICLSTGGNVSMAMSVSSVINFYGGCEMDIPLFSKMPKHETKFLTDNLDQFYFKLHTLI